MANIWLTLYITGKIVAVWGPMQYSTVEDCQQDAIGFSNLAVTALDTPSIDKPIFQCEKSELAPAIGKPLKLEVPIVPKGTMTPDSSQKN